MATLPRIETVPGEPLVRFDSVSIGFEETEVLHDVSFEVALAETKVILGESGSGKTVLLKMAAGLLRPDSGKIFVMGNDLTEMNEADLLHFRRQLGFVFQEGALFDSLTVASNVSFRMDEDGVTPAETEQRVREALRFVELEDAYEKFPDELSGGMRRRVSIARALVNRPTIVCYDSPTGGLDPVTSQTIITLILRLRDLSGVTALMATHRLPDGFALANFEFDSAAGRVIPIWEEKSRTPRSVTKFLVLRDGRIYFEGEPNELLKSNDKYLTQFLS
jgi:phospholipid/cholesterol/gamma-HCH transport system ATP-binding protein